MARRLLMLPAMEPTPIELSLIEACERFEGLPHDEPSQELAMLAADLAAVLEFEASVSLSLESQPTV